MKTIVFAGGEYINTEFYRKVTLMCDLKIAADSGAEFMMEMGIMPDVLIGDMDSITSETLKKCTEKGVSVSRFPTEKDEIDTELALIEAQNRQSDVIFVAGAFGNRLDQTFGVFRLMERFERTVLFNEKLYSIVVKNRVDLKSAPGEVWSVIPLKKDILNLSLKGFRYELTGKKMEYLRPYGISNEAFGEKIKIDPGDGTLLVFRYHNGLIDWVDELSGVFKMKKTR